MKKITITVEGKKIILDFNQHFAFLTKINESLNRGAAVNYEKSDLTYVDVPEIVGITGACENVDTLFKIQSRFDLPLFFTQTGQLSLEQALQSFHGVYTIIHSGRAEEEEDVRHLRQFRLTEEEFDCTLAGMRMENYDEDKMFAALLNHIQKTIQSMVRNVIKDNEEILKKKYKRNVNKLKLATEENFLQIEYEKAVKLLNKLGFPNLIFGDDLKAEHEARLIRELNHKKELPLFITKYPKKIKFFNMKVYDKDPRVVLSADLIFPYSGEGTGSAVREHDFARLNERLLTSTMYKLHLERGGKYEDFQWYLDIIKNKRTLPHAGYGIGNERVLQYILGEKDIRKASLFSLLGEETGDWDKKKYGHAGIINSPKKHILLTIGQIEHKKYLLSYIRKLAATNETILYATEKTHQFLAKNKVQTALVYKISEVGQSPNIADLLVRRVFNLIINTPTREKIGVGKEFTDGKLIRKTAVAMGVALVTDPEVAAMVINNLTIKKI